MYTVQFVHEPTGQELFIRLETPALAAAFVMMVDASEQFIVTNMPGVLIGPSNHMVGSINDEGRMRL